jgi:hypothetical protein
MSDNFSNPLPATKFPKLDAVACSQRHLSKRNVFMTCVGLAATAVLWVSLL